MAAPEEEVGRSFLRRIGGRHSSPLGTVKAGIKVETGELKKVSRELDVIRSSVSALTKEMNNLAKASAAALGGMGTGSSSGARAQNGMPLGVNSSPKVAPGRIGRPGSAGGAAGGLGSAMGGMRGMFANFGGVGMATMIGGQVAGQFVGQLDHRIDRGMNYASDVDRLNVMLQQQYGVSQGQVMGMRRPLTNYRLGAGGVNALMQYQAFTGIQATPGMASSIAGIRAMTGYSKTTADVLTDQMSVLQPQVANRMFMMLGSNAYTYGGGTQDPMKMRQNIVRTMGLANPNILRSAALPGSVTRARMTDAGIPQEIQDEVISYARSQVQFNKRGGQGMYDPSKKADRRRMGIEENFATQQEETDRMRGAREETFTRRNLDNMASLERNTQTMVHILGSIEDKLSGVLGARTSQRGWLKIGGRMLQLGGAAALIASGLGAPIGMGLGIGAIAGGSVLSGDPMTATEGGSAAQYRTKGSSDSGRDGSIAIPVGFGGKRQSLDAVKQRADFRSMNPKMQERLLAMFRENPNVGIGQGTRSSRDQESMFRSRYRKTNKKTNLFWDGAYWEHVSGAPAAPPGRSMHEIGLAADLVGDLAWMNANASRFGLKHFAGVNNEPWHVQPSELPNSRKQYEESGAQWGTDGGFDSAGTAKSGPVTGAEEADPSEMANFSGTNKSGLRGYTHIKFGKNGSAVTQARSTAQNGMPLPPGSLSGEQVAQAAYRAGFRGQDLIKMVAIAKRESRWNPRAYNPNRATGDRSYGLWQLNTLNTPRGGKMEDLVKGILGDMGLPNKNIPKDFDALFDPYVNAQVAYQFYKRNGNTTRPWGGYKGQSDTYSTNLQEAAQIVKNAHLGDPMPETKSAQVTGSTHISHAPTYQITVAPQISFIGSPSSPDLRKIAQEVTSLIEEQVRTLEMRNA